LRRFGNTQQSPIATRTDLHFPRIRWPGESSWIPELYWQRAYCCSVPTETFGNGPLQQSR